MSENQHLDFDPEKARIAGARANHREAIKHVFELREQENHPEAIDANPVRRNLA